MRLVFQLPASITSVVDAPRLVSSDASPTRPSGLRGERGEPVGDVRVCLDAGFGPVPGVDPPPAERSEESEIVY